MRFQPVRARRGGVINMTSLIDMMFLLVIFILLAARFEPQSGVKVALPGGGTPMEASRKTLTMTLFVTEDHQLFLGEEPVTLATLPARLRALRERLQAEEGEGANPVLVVYGDRDFRFGFFTELMDATRAAGQTTMNFRTRAPTPGTESNAPPSP